MPRTALTVQTLKGPYATIGAGEADIAFVAADAVNKNKFPFTGKELLLAKNSDPTNPYTVTIDGVADPYGRTASITAYSLAAGDIVAFQLAMIGWLQSDGNIWLEASNAAILFAVVRHQQ